MGGSPGLSSRSHLESGSVPSRQFSDGLVGALEEVEQHAVWLLCLPHLSVRQQELSQGGVIEARRGPDRPVPEALRFRVGVGVTGRRRSKRSLRCSHPARTRNCSPRGCRPFPSPSRGSSVRRRRAGVLAGPKSG
jgi:hypothetical protein